jgi:hypothetical protein
MLRCDDAQSGGIAAVLPLSAGRDLNTLSEQVEVLSQVGPILMAQG